MFYIFLAACCILFFIPMRMTHADYPYYGPVYDEPFVLLTMLYNEKKSARIAEYIACLEKNKQHLLIDTIHVLYDTSNDDTQSLVMYDYLKLHNITVTSIDGRATFGDFFDIAREMYPNRRIIIANADIYFNDTLARLANHSLHNTFCALTRWDVAADGSLTPYLGLYGDSHDVWIFVSPIRSFKHDRISLGVLDCDGRIALQAKKSGLTVMNPSKTVHCCHLHLSELRNYQPRTTPYPKHEALIVPGTML